MRTSPFRDTTARPLSPPALVPQEITWRSAPAIGHP